MTQKAFCVDLGRCIGCNACRIACKEIRGLADTVHRRTVHYLPEDLIETPLRNYLTIGCNHCDNPGCMQFCPAAAYSKNDEGIVIHDPEKCVGCRMCLWSCPYEVPCYNEEAGIMDKCDMCYERQAQGLEPVCVASCPLSAIKVMDVSEVPADYQRGVAGYPDITLTGANIYVKLPANVEQIRR